MAHFHSPDAGLLIVGVQSDSKVVYVTTRGHFNHTACLCGGISLVFREYT